jgi:hypothetical protein
VPKRGTASYHTWRHYIRDQMEADDNIHARANAVGDVTANMRLQSARAEADDSGATIPIPLQEWRGRGLLDPPIPLPGCGTEMWKLMTSCIDQHSIRRDSSLRLEEIQVVLGIVLLVLFLGETCDYLPGQRSG